MSNATTPNVVRAGWIMTASLLLSRVLGLIREAVISGRFGMGAETDAYVLSFQIPDIIFFLIAGGALSAAFIPVFSEYFHTNREEDAWRVFNSLFGIMSAALLVVITLAWIFAEPLTYVVAMEATANREMVAYLSRIVLPAQ
jgi:putative peptidoglycan lipid II flippase